MDKEKMEKTKEEKLGLSLTGTQIISQTDQSGITSMQHEKNKVSPNAVDMKSHERKSSRNAVANLEITAPNSNATNRSKADGAEG